MVKLVIITYFVSYPHGCFEGEGVFTNKQYRLGSSISIKMDSQPCGGTIVCIHSYLDKSMFRKRMVSSHVPISI